MQGIHFMFNVSHVQQVPPSPPAPEVKVNV